MDNLAHTLVGLAVSKTGFERSSPGVTAICIVAANAADADVISGLFGDRWTALHYHRGITHSIVGTLAIAVIVPLVFCFADLILARLSARPRSLKVPWVVLASLVAAATHPLMDWTNNYGVRLLLPGSSRWFYGDLVFIVDPYIWCVFGAAGFLLTSRRRWQVAFWAIAGTILSFVFIIAGGVRNILPHAPLLLAVWFGLVGVAITLYLRRVPGGHRNLIAGVALALLVGYWSSLAMVHQHALQEARRISNQLALQNSEHVIKLAAMPVLGDATLWQCVAESDKSFYRFQVGIAARDPQPQRLARLVKPEGLERTIVMQAAADRRARALNEFARFPFGRVSGDCLTETFVQFADLRYTEPGTSRGNFAVTIPVECQPR